MTDKHIGIVGLGYVGLPLAISFTEAGLQVTGVDTSPSRVETLTNGRSPIDDIEDARLRAALNSGLQIRLNDPAQLRPCDVIIVCVPTPISRSNRKLLLVVSRFGGGDSHEPERGRGVLGVHHSIRR